MKNDRIIDTMLKMKDGRLQKSKDKVKPGGTTRYTNDEIRMVVLDSFLAQIQDTSHRRRVVTEMQFVNVIKEVHGKYRMFIRKIHKEYAKLNLPEFNQDDLYPLLKEGFRSICIKADKARYLSALEKAKIKGEENGK